ncbi:uncharacterized protein LOC128231069 [Mya arenaria]|uniref:uncharacterized protein LOC128215906 n=1 Tax=Mya arenaria TaxID=6604 RepID=UPI0022E14F1E|nr:uncharacterized protein LOC128215906 [Mya arenaria]XP_052799453.1 uncharacterized protein LOC128231069 [Mya arenaria]
MTWRRPGKTKELFHGTIVKTGEDENSLLSYATQAYNAILKGKALSDGIQGAPEELYSFNVKRGIKSGSKRERSKTERLRASEIQDDQLSPKKKQKKEVAKQLLPKEKKQETSEIMGPKSPSTALKTAALQTGRLMLDMHRQFDLGSDTENTAGMPLSKNKNETTSQCDQLLPVLTTTPVKDTMQPNQICEQVTSPVSLQKTWTACQSAMDIVNYMPPASDSNRQYIPAPTPEVLQTLQAICQPEFVTFLRSLVTHFKNDSGGNSCSQSYSQTSFNQASFLMDLMDRTDAPTHTSLYEQPGLNDSLNLSSPIQSSTPAKVSYKTGLLATVVPQETSQSSSQHNPSAARYQSNADVSMPSVRRSPRKPKTVNSSDMVKLLEHSDILIDRDLKRKACSAAKTKSGKEGSVLLYRLCSGLFSIKEMATCRGLGIGQAKSDPSRPTLDQAKVKLLKDYVVTWCKAESKRIPTEAEMNGAITERIGYARKQMKARK